MSLPGKVIYDAAAALTLTAYSPVLAYKAMTRNKYRAGFSQRLGYLKPGVAERFLGRPFVWVHACSVGEVQASVPIIRSLRRELSGCGILVSTVTETGNNVARELNIADDVVFLPLDLHHIWYRVLEKLRPRAFVIMETEIWPAMIGSLSAHGVPLALVNGRISDRALPRYRIAAPFFKGVLNKLDLVAAQTEEDAKRYRSIGAPAARVAVLGNVKYDAVSLDVSEEDKARFRRELNLAADDVVWIAGSTFAGEERLAARVYLELRGRYPQLRLIIAPRHPERFAEAERDIREAGLTVTRRSERRPPERTSVILLDTMGELSRLFSVGSIAFMGKSILAEGGQNPLEPAGHGCAILHGPHMANFRDVVRFLDETGGHLVVNNEREMRDAVNDLLARPDHRRELGERARRAVDGARGAADRIAARVAQLLPLRKLSGEG